MVGVLGCYVRRKCCTTNYKGKFVNDRSVFFLYVEVYEMHWPIML